MVQEIAEILQFRIRAQLLYNACVHFEFSEFTITADTLSQYSIISRFSFDIIMWAISTHISKEKGSLALRD